MFANGILYSAEHGPDSDDEINIIEKGRNFGWPTVKGFCNESAEQTFCSANNVKEPITAWTPTIATSGIGFYDNDAIPQWKNSLLVATLKNQRLMQVKLDDAHTAVTGITEFFANTYGRMRDVCIAPDGKVYICTSNGGNDKIIIASKKEALITIKRLSRKSTIKYLPGSIEIQIIIFLPAYRLPRQLNSF